MSDVGTILHTYDTAFAAMCIMEEIAAPSMADEPWQSYRDAWGVSALRDAALKLAPFANADWDRVNAAHDAAVEEWQQAHVNAVSGASDGAVPAYPDNDPGSFDYDFIPMWLRLKVDWSDSQDGPRVRGSNTP